MRSERIEKQVVEGFLESERMGLGRGFDEVLHAQQHSADLLVQCPQNGGLAPAKPPQSRRMEPNRRPAVKSQTPVAAPGTARVESWAAYDGHNVLTLPQRCEMARRRELRGHGARRSVRSARRLAIPVELGQSHGEVRDRACAASAKRAPGGADALAAAELHFGLPRCGFRLEFFKLRV